MMVPSASRPPPALPARRPRLRTRAPEAPGADRRILLTRGRKSSAWPLALEALRAGRHSEHLLRRMEEQLGIRLRIAPAFGEVRSMRGIRMRFEEQPGLCRRPARRFPPPSAAAGLKSPTPCSTPTTAATPEGTERQEEDVAQTWAGFRSIGITHGVIRPVQRMRGEPRVRLNQPGLATAPGFSSPTPPCTSPNIACRRSRQASHRCAVRRGGCRRGFPCRAADQRGAGPAPARWARSEALAPTVDALP